MFFLLINCQFKNERNKLNVEKDHFLSDFWMPKYFKISRKKNFVSEKKENLNIGQRTLSSFSRICSRLVKDANVTKIELKQP